MKFDFYGLTNNTNLHTTVNQKCFNNIIHIIFIFISGLIENNSIDFKYNLINDEIFVQNCDCINLLTY